MEEQVNKIKLVISTLEGLDIKATKGNMDRLLGCMQVLEQVADSLVTKEGSEDGNSDAE